MSFFPHVLEAQYISEYKIRLRFNDDVVKIVNLESYPARGGVFEQMKDLDFFRKFFVDLNTLCWPNGADIAPERLYEIGKIVETRSPVVAEENGLCNGSIP